MTPGRLLALLVALSGLFVMHGLYDHGAAGHLEGAGVHAMSGHHAAMAGLDADAAPELVTAIPVAALPGEGGGLGGHDTTMAGLCLAVLLLGLLMAAAPRGPRWRLAPRSRPAPPGGVARRARAPDPPDLTRLCVQRC